MTQDWGKEGEADAPTSLLSDDHDNNNTNRWRKNGKYVDCRLPDASLVRNQFASSCDTSAMVYCTY